MSPELSYILFIIVGLFSGLIGGLLGLGGGVITVPFLYFFYSYSKNYPSKMMQIAVCTSLASSVITAAISSYFQMRNRAIHLHLMKWILPTLVIGCVLGSLFAHHMSSHILGKIFGIMAALMGLYFFFPKLPPLNIAEAPNRSLYFFSFLIGLLSSLLGIGGGSLAFPLLLGYQIPAKNASATSSLTTFVSAGIGTIAYLILSSQISEPFFTFGYIDLGAFISLSIGSVLSVPFGVKLSHTLPVTYIKRIFGGCLFIIGLSMLLF